MRIVYFGSGSFGVPSLDALARSEHDIVHVVTQPAKPAGRGRKMHPTPIAEYAAQAGLDCTECPDVNTPGFVDRVRSWRPNLLVVIAFAQKIGPDLLNLENCRAINLHGSLLPRFRGAAPINWAIIHGCPETGITVIELNERWDAGAILGREATPIRSGERAGELHDRLAAMGPGLLISVVDAIARGDDRPLPQAETHATRAPKLRKTDAALDWTRPADELANRVHGLWPWPGAYTFLTSDNRSERLTLARVEPLPDADDQGRGPGELAADLTVVTGQGRLRLIEVKPDGSRLMSFEEYVRGRHLAPGARFQTPQPSQP